MAHSIKKPTLSLPNLDHFDPYFGGGSWPLYVDHVQEFAWISNIFSDSELEAIIEMGNHKVLSKATTGGETQSDENRNSFVNFLFPNSTTSWVFARLASAIVEVNANYFNFDLTGLEQGLQFTRYEAPGQHYDWHTDRGFLMGTRKLSLTLQLNDPSEYEGGELQLKFGREETTIERMKGCATFFPSFALHRVKPITKGTRYSLVAWISGPPFK